LERVLHLLLYSTILIVHTFKHRFHSVILDALVDILQRLHILNAAEVHANAVFLCQRPPVQLATADKISPVDTDLLARHLPALLAERERDALVTPDVRSRAGYFQARGLGPLSLIVHCGAEEGDLTEIVIAPLHSVPAAYTTLTDVEILWYVGDRKADGAAVAAHFDIIFGTRVSCTGDL
jgi:hypothetical protein